MLARGTEIRLAAGQGGGQFVPELRRRPSGEPLLAVGERQNQFSSVRLSVGRFLDQPPAGGFLYPQWMSGVTCGLEYGGFVLSSGGGMGSSVSVVPGATRVVFPLATQSFGMKLRGERECKDCRTRWSYYETGEATCPNCGSLRSVAVEDKRKRHTDSPVEIDLSPYRDAVSDDADILDVADEIEDDCRTYLRKRGFIHAGELQPLDDTFLAVQELRAAIADERRDKRIGVDRGQRIDDETERYLLALLAGADLGERPAPDEVPDSLTDARGLAYATAVHAYREDVATYLDDTPDSEGRRVLERIRDHGKRLNALGGDVPPVEAERLVDACNDLHRYLTGEDGRDNGALSTALDRLDRLE